MYLLPDLYNNNVYVEYGVVIDLLRNSTMITKLFENGIYELVPLNTVTSAFQNRFKGYLKFGEENSLKIEGFDFGNSPYEIENVDFSQKRGIIYSTNGTKAIIKIGQNIPNLLITSMRNMKSVVNYITRMDIDISVILSGDNGRISLEDVYCGGFLMETLIEWKNGIEMNDSAYMSLILYRNAKNRLKRSVKKTEHGRELIRKGFQKDIDIAVKKNVASVIPVYKRGVIRLTHL